MNSSNCHSKQRKELEELIVEIIGQQAVKFSGVPGPRGFEGIDGPAGPPGHAGNSGPPGNPGVSGAPGINGIDGADGGGATTFKKLTDTPADYIAQAKKLIRVNMAADAVEYTDSINAGSF